MMKRWLGVVVMSLLALAGCGVNIPASVRYDAGNTGFVAGDTSTTASSINAMAVRFTASLGNLGSDGANFGVTPVVSGATAFVPEMGRLAAFDVNGQNGCSGTPTTCQPKWTADFGHPDWNSLWGAEVYGDTVYVLASGPITAPPYGYDPHGVGALFAFDVDGQRNCAGTPVVCQPLWTASLVSGDAPVAYGGHIFAFDMATRRVDVFSAAGADGCAGTPVVCQPLWTTPVLDVETPPVRPAVVGDRVYVADRKGDLIVSDATGQQGCSGSPVVCQPLWSAPSPWQEGAETPSPVVVDGRVFVARATTTFTTFNLAAFDAAGSQNCSGTPVVCQPLWSTPLQGSLGGPMSLAAAYGRVYVPSHASGAPSTGTVVYDATGAGCSGSPMSCTPLFTAAGQGKTPTIADGLILQPSDTGVAAFDASGATSCTAGTCGPVAQATIGPDMHGFALADGKLFAVRVASNGTGTLVGAW
jgi:hypothetical protein